MISGDDRTRWDRRTFAKCHHQETAHPGSLEGSGKIGKLVEIGAFVLLEFGNGKKHPAVGKNADAIAMEAILILRERRGECYPC